ncbi:hypothetical protein L3X38_030061 [Prunus dulcis]|uniref:Uncharacterized protein n=1 Tax=Prunus dulcis TaxID=3755 RepID=A0AAD4VT08_PRUDU|nr:hypothetical protein L3X38_030061 [Prunus dulcis]
MIYCILRAKFPILWGFYCELITANLRNSNSWLSEAKVTRFFSFLFPAFGGLLFGLSPKVHQAFINNHKLHYFDAEKFVH